MKASIFAMVLTVLSIEGVLAQNTTEIPEGGKKSVAELEADARKDVKEVFDDWYERMDKVRRSDRFEMYVNSIWWQLRTIYNTP